MDTTYYSFETRKIKVSGGTDLLTIVPAAVAAPTSPAGEVLDFDRCRRKLETKAAWKGLAQAVAEVKTPAVADNGEAEGDAAFLEERYAPVERVSAPRRGRTARRESRARKALFAPWVNKVRKALRTPRVERAGGWLELLSSVAVILVCLCAGWAFLALV